MEVFTKKFKNVEDRILIDTTISFLKNKMKSNTLIDTGATISCISKDVVKTLKLQPIGVDRVSTPSGTAVLNKNDIMISNYDSHTQFSLRYPANSNLEF